jgi:hypothetical protein
MSFRNVYIIRHQKGYNNLSNCIDSNSFYNTENICQILKPIKFEHVFSKFPYNNKHIRPIQTAANICSFLDKSLQLVYDARDIPNKHFSCTLLIWNHDDINSILKHYGFIDSFQWPEENYNGCIYIHDSNWHFNENFLKNNSFFDDCCLW